MFAGGGRAPLIANPWEYAQSAFNAYSSPAQPRQQELSYCLPRQDTSLQIDQPKPQRGEKYSEFLQKLNREVFRRILNVLEANAQRETDGQLARVSVPPPTDTDTTPSQLMSHTTTDLEFAVPAAHFPDLSRPEDVSLAAKLALVSPAPADLLGFDDLEVATSSLEPPCSSLAGLDDGANAMRDGSTAWDTPRLERAMKITSQWLREAFGDDSLPAARKAPPVDAQTAADTAQQIRESEGPPPPPPASAPPFHCNACERALKAQAFRIRCAECDDYDLCESCFCEGRESGQHRREHYYIPIGPNKFPLFNVNWTADEEACLLEAVGRFGFGNWSDVAEQVAQGVEIGKNPKERDECEKRYFDFHLADISEGTPGAAAAQHPAVAPFSALVRQPAYPAYKQLLKLLWTMEDDLSAEGRRRRKCSADSVMLPQMSLDSLMAGAESSGGDSAVPLNSAPPKIKHAIILPPAQLHPPRQTIVGFQQYRGDFDSEHLNRAEIDIADVEIRECESPVEKQIKLEMLSIYNNILNERYMRRKVLIENRLFDQKNLMQFEKIKLNEEKIIGNILRPLWKHFFKDFSYQLPPLFKNAGSKTTSTVGLNLALGGAHIADGNIIGGNAAPGNLAGGTSLSGNMEHPSGNGAFQTGQSNAGVFGASNFAQTPSRPSAGARPTSATGKQKGSSDATKAIVIDPVGDLTEEEIDEFVRLFLDDKILIRRLKLLTKWKTQGLVTLKDVLESGGQSAQLIQQDSLLKEEAIENEADNKGGPSDVRVMDDSKRPVQLSNQALSGAERKLCSALNVRLEFFLLLKDLLGQELASAVARNLKVVDPTTGKKLLKVASREAATELPEEQAGDESISLNDFVMSLQVAVQSTCGRPGLVIPRKKKVADGGGRSLSATGQGTATQHLDLETSSETATTSQEARLGPLPPGALPALETEEGEIEEEDEDDDDTALLEAASPSQMSGGTTLHEFAMATSSNASDISEHHSHSNGSWPPSKSNSTRLPTAPPSIIAPVAGGRVPCSGIGLGKSGTWLTAESSLHGEGDAQTPSNYPADEEEEEEGEDPEDDNEEGDDDDSLLNPNE